MNKEKIQKGLSCLIDNGIDPDESETVLQALGYILLDEELFPENLEEKYELNFTIETLNDNGSGMEFKTKEEFLEELSMEIDDCIKNGGTFFDVQVDADASVFYKH